MDQPLGGSELGLACLHRKMNFLGCPETRFTR